MSAEPLDKQVSYHAFSPDKTQVALSKNDDLVYMYATNGKENPKEWTLNQTVAEHGGDVSGIDWCAKTNQIVTCGHDRNAYVWKYDDAEKAWKPTLVILRINRAATCVRWSPNGDKFAVGSGAKCVPVCHFESSQNWWISKMIKKHKSTVLDVDWSPEQKFLVTGACDFKCRIFSAYIDGIDSAESDSTLTASFGAKSNDFGECLMEFDQAKAWVQGVAWSPGGMNIAFCGHGSTLSFVDLANGNAVQTIYQKGLPTADVFWKDDDNLVAIGFDHNPTIYTKSGSEYAEGKKLDEAKKVEKTGGVSAASKARNMFQDADTRGKTGGGKGSFKEQPTIATQHKNNILCYQYEKGGSEFTTSGVDGRIIRWKL